MDTADLNAIVVFARVAESRSLSRAARALRLPVSTASRRVTALERQLGVQLLNRTTRNISLTECGEAYYAHCRRIIEELAAGEDAVATLRDRPSGTLRFAAPAVFARYFLPPIIARFRLDNPDVRVEVRLAHQSVDLVQEGLDFMVRCGAIPDSTLRARKLGVGQCLIVASPRYLERAGHPAHPRDLAGHALLQETVDAGHLRWNFRRGSETCAFLPEPAFASNDAELLHDACLQGAGVARLAAFMCEDDIRSARLVRLLPGWQADRVDVTIVYPVAQNLPSKVRSFMDYLAAAWAGQRALDLELAA
jgi:DNA-binding transcriptional LysR family regulator